MHFNSEYFTSNDGERFLPLLLLPTRPWLLLLEDHILVFPIHTPAVIASNMDSLPIPPRARN